MIFSSLGAPQKYSFFLLQSWFLCNNYHFHQTKIDVVRTLLYSIKLGNKKALARSSIPRYLENFIKLTKFLNKISAK